MDKGKLERLRELYAEADGSEYLTERFRHVGEKLADKVRRIRPEHDIDVVIPIPDSGRTAPGIAD